MVISFYKRNWLILAAIGREMPIYSSSFRNTWLRQREYPRVLCLHTKSNDHIAYFQIYPRAISIWSIWMLDCHFHGIVISMERPYWCWSPNFIFVVCEIMSSCFESSFIGLNDWIGNENVVIHTPSGNKLKTSNLGRFSTSQPFFSFCCCQFHFAFCFWNSISIARNWVISINQMSYCVSFSLQRCY